MSNIVYKAFKACITVGHTLQIFDKTIILLIFYSFLKIMI